MPLLGNRLSNGLILANHVHLELDNDNDGRRRRRVCPTLDIALSALAFTA